MTTTQKNRLLYLKTPLAEDFLLINRFSGSEGLSELFNYEVELVHEENDEGFEPTDVDIQSILGQAVTVRITQRDETTRTFSGIVNSFSKGTRSVRFSFYNATIVPHVWLLTQNVQSRIFQHKSVPEILREVFDGFEVSYEIQGDFKNRNISVQYCESDFDYASRLMEEEGLYYYFEHSEGSHKMIIGNTPQSHIECPSKSEIDYFIKTDPREDFISTIRNLWVDYKLQPGKIAFRDYNFMVPTNNLEVNQPSLFSVGNNQEMEIYDYPGGYGRKYDHIDRGGADDSAGMDGLFPDKQRTAENTMNALDSKYRVLSGTSDCSSLTAGHRFSLDKHPNADLNGQYICTYVTHDAQQNPAYVSEEVADQPYSNSFSCISHGSGNPPFCPQRKTAKPVIQGSQTATVVGPSGEEIFTDKYGRVKVQFHWDREGKADADSSCWTRVAKDMAGNKYGTMYIPRVGWEVLVDFIGGDPDKPVITGSLYNPETMPHYELPEYKTLSYIKTRTSPDDGSGFNELRFEDKQGKEQVFIHSNKRMDIRVKGSFYETCGGNRQERIGVRSDNKPGGNLAITVGGSHDLHIKADEFIGVDGKLNEGVTGDVVEGYQGNQQTVVASNVEINARAITLEGSQSVTLKVGSSFVVVDMMGVTISGPMVKINSGGSASPTGPATIDDPLDADSADTGEPGYLDRPRSGGGRRGRNRRTLNGQHAPSVTRNNDGSYNVGGDNLRVEGSDAFVSNALSDMSTLYNTPTGRNAMDNINNGTHTTTVRELPLANAPGVGGGQATRVDGAGSTTPGAGSDTIIEYAPEYAHTYTDQNGDSVDGVRPAVLGHEMMHAGNNDTGNNLRNNPEPAEPTSNEEESQTIGIHGHANDPNTENELIRELGGEYQRIDHDSSVISD